MKGKHAMSDVTDLPQADSRCAKTLSHFHVRSQTLFIMIKNSLFNVACLCVTQAINQYTVVIVYS